MNPANYGAISFPSLGIEVDPARSFAVGPLTIHFYGLIIACGLMLAVNVFSWNLSSIVVMVTCAAIGVTVYACGKAGGKA